MPKVYTWISLKTPPNSVILESIPYSIDGFVVDFALIHKRKMVNSWRLPSGKFGQNMPYPTDPNFQTLIQDSVIDYIVLHPRFFGIINQVDLKGYKIVKEFKFDPDLPFSDWANAVVYKKLKP
jgi:hypothetical protein